MRVVLDTKSWVVNGHTAPGVSLEVFPLVTSLRIKSNQYDSAGTHLGNSSFSLAPQRLEIEFDFMTSSEAEFSKAQELVFKSSWMRQNGLVDDFTVQIYDYYVADFGARQRAFCGANPVPFQQNGVGGIKYQPQLFCKLSVELKTRHACGAIFAVRIRENFAIPDSTCPVTSLPATCPLSLSIPSGVVFMEQFNLNNYVRGYLATGDSVCSIAQVASDSNIGQLSGISRGSSGVGSFTATATTGAVTWRAYIDEMTVLTAGPSIATNAVSFIGSIVGSLSGDISYAVCAKQEDNLYVNLSSTFTPAPAVDESSVTHTLILDPSATWHYLYDGGNDLFEPTSGPAFNPDQPYKLGLAIKSEHYGGFVATESITWDYTGMSSGITCRGVDYDTSRTIDLTSACYTPTEAAVFLSLQPPSPLSAVYTLKASLNGGPFTQIYTGTAMTWTHVAVDATAVPTVVDYELTIADGFAATPATMTATVTFDCSGGGIGN